MVTHLCRIIDLMADEPNQVRSPLDPSEVFRNVIPLYATNYKKVKK
jgi:hypothetical protein